MTDKDLLFHWVETKPFGLDRDKVLKGVLDLMGKSKGNLRKDMASFLAGVKMRLTQDIGRAKTKHCKAVFNGQLVFLEQIILGLEKL